MESLRAQYAETQGALTDINKKYRKLRADHQAAAATWAKEKHDFEARIRQLEAENQRLRQPQAQARADTAGAVPKQLRTATRHSSGAWEPDTTPTRRSSTTELAVRAGGDEETEDQPVMITRSRMQEIETRFQDIKNALAEKTELCDGLQLQVQAQSGNSLTTLPAFELTDAQVADRWTKLRDGIRELSLTYFNAEIPTKLVSDKAREEFVQLSAQWESYLSNGQLACYIFRALIWRYLFACLFDKFARVWGRDVGGTVAQVAKFLEGEKTTTEEEMREWRMHTAALLNKSCVVNATVGEEVAAKIYDATNRFMKGVDHDGLKKAVYNIVAMGAEISALLARSRFVALMSDEPGSALTQGFPYQEATMELRDGTTSVVDMMISPCLLKKEVDYSVLVKAEVVC